MKNEKLKEIQEKLENVLGELGTDLPQFLHLREKLEKKQKEKDAKIMAETMAKSFAREIRPFLEEIRQAGESRKLEGLEEIKEAIRGVRIEPRISVASPKPQITVRPKIEVKGREKLKDEVKIKNFSNLLRTLRENIRQGFQEMSSKRPMSVVLTHEGKEYKASFFGGGPQRVWIKDSNNKQVDITSERHSVIGEGTLTVSGTPTQLSATSISCKRLFIQAHQENKNVVVVGGADVVAALNTRKGLGLFATQGEWFYPDNLNRIYIDSVVKTDKVHYYYED